MNESTSSRYPGKRKHHKTQSHGRSNSRFRNDPHQSTSGAGPSRLLDSSGYLNPSPGAPQGPHLHNAPPLTQPDSLDEPAVHLDSRSNFNAHDTFMSGGHRQWAGGYALGYGARPPYMQPLHVLQQNNLQAQPAQNDIPAPSYRSTTPLSRPQSLGNGSSLHADAPSFQPGMDAHSTGTDRTHAHRF